MSYKNHLIKTHTHTQQPHMTRLSAWPSLCKIHMLGVCFIRSVCNTGDDDHGERALCHGAPITDCLKVLSQYKWNFLHFLLGNF